jgi:peptidoglycan/LPS O-acetylase OafA/YrhL
MRAAARTADVVAGRAGSEPLRDVGRTVSYNPSLDGLRALAVAGVVAEHAGFRIGGFYGVTAFFVVSGYLITALLLAERTRTGGIGMRAFYRRRFARLAPALLLVLACTVGWLVLTVTPPREWWAGLVGALTYSTNFLDASPLQPHVGSYFEYTWSLGIEEQFYLVWPVLLVGVLALGRRWGRRVLLAVCLAVIAGAWLSRAAMLAGHASPQRVNFSFDSHMDAIALGAVVAIVLAGRRPGRVLRWMSGAAGALALGLLCAIVADRTILRLREVDANGYGQVALLCTVLVIALAASPAGRLGRALSWRPLVHLGRLSYGLYLWNMLVRNVFVFVTGEKPAHAGWTGLLWVALLVALAEASYRYVESPLRRRFAHRPPRPQSLPSTDAEPALRAEPASLPQGAAA